MKEKKVAIILTALAIVITIIGSTFAYFTWATNASQNTTVTFTVTPTFSCSADGGGNITSSEKQLAPAACTNSTYAIQRTVTVSPVINQAGVEVYLDLWLKVNSISANLSASENFKYALTTSSNSCTSGTVVASGNFYGSAANDEILLLDAKTYSTTGTDTYYLWIWLDAAETNNNTQNQTFNFELGGSCTDHSQWEYTLNVYNENYPNSNYMKLGDPIPNTITSYGTPEAVLASNTNQWYTYTYFLRHKIGNGTLWCYHEYEDGVFNGESYCLFSTQAECNAAISDWNYSNVTYSCVEKNVSNGILESYVGFVIDSTIVDEVDAEREEYIENCEGDTQCIEDANTFYEEITAGTYYIKGGDNGKAYNDNVNLLLDVFGSSRCYIDNSSGYGNIQCCVLNYSYCVDANNAGRVTANNGSGGYNCEVGYTGYLGCM